MEEKPSNSGEMGRVRNIGGDGNSSGIILADSIIPETCITKEILQPCLHQCYVVKLR